MIALREKLVAFAVHFVITLAVALAAAAVIFFVWYPEPLRDMLGGTQLFLLVAGCDLALGPLISLVIYNSRKSRRELVTDYSIVGLIQLSAFVYGMYVVAVARPAYVVFSTYRLEVITAQQIEDAELTQVPLPQYRHRPWLGPEFVAVVIPAREASAGLLEGLAGKDESVRPRYYVPYESQLAQIQTKINSLSELTQKLPNREAERAAALKEHGVAAEHAGWLLTRHRRQFWTALMDTRTGYPFAYLQFAPE